MPDLAKIAEDVDRLLVEILQDVGSNCISAGSGAETAGFLELDSIALFLDIVVTCLGFFGILGLFSVAFGKPWTDESSAEKDGGVSVVLSV